MCLRSLIILKSFLKTLFLLNSWYEVIEKSITFEKKKIFFSK